MVKRGNSNRKRNNSEQKCLALNWVFQTLFCDSFLIGGVSLLSLHLCIDWLNAKNNFRFLPYILVQKLEMVLSLDFSHQNNIYFFFQVNQTMVH